MKIRDTSVMLPTNEVCQSTLFLDITEAANAAKEPTMMRETRKKRQARSVLPRGTRIQPVMARIRERVMRMTM